MIDHNYFIKTFQFLPFPSLILSPNENGFIIQNANDAYLKLIHRKANFVIDKNFEDVLSYFTTDNSADFINNLSKSLSKAIKNNASDKLLFQKVKLESSNETHYLDFENTAVFDDDKKLLFVIHTVIDITAQYLNQEQLITEKEFGLSQQFSKKTIRNKTNQDALINGTKDLIWSVDVNMNIIAANLSFSKAMEKLTGKKLKEGDTLILEIFGKETMVKWTAYYERALKGESFRIQDENYDAINDLVRYSSITFTPIYNEHNQVLGVACYSKDITEDTLNLIALEKAKKEVTKIMDSSLDIICTIDEAGNFVKLNAVSEKVWGYKPEELVNQPYINHVYSEDIEKTNLAAEDIMNGIEKTNFENRYVKKDGTLIPLIWSARWDDNEKIMYCIARDATEKIAREQELVASNKNYKNLFDNHPLPMFIWDFETQNIIDCNEEALLKYGYTRQEFLKLNIKEIRPEEDIPLIEAAYKNEAVYGQVHKKIWRHKKKNQEIMYLNITGHLIDYNGRRASLVLLDDVSEKLRAEEELRASEEKYRILYQLSPLPKWIYDIETLNFLDVNNAAIQHYGYSREEFLQLNLKDVRPVEEIPSLINAREIERDRSKTIHFGIFTHQKKDKTIIKVEVSGNFLHFNSKKCMMVVCVDVTEREKAFEELIDKETKLENAQQIAKLGNWQLNLNDNSLYWSSIAYDIWGIEQNVKPNLELLLSTIHPEDKKKFIKEQYAALNLEKELDFEHRIIASDGSLKWVHQKAVIEKDINGKSVLFTGTVQDITPQKVLQVSLEESNLRFKYVTKATFDAVWDWDLIAETIYWGDGFQNIFGYNFNDTNTDIGFWTNHIHPDEKEMVSKEINDTIASHDDNWMSEYRFQRKDGSYAIVADKAIIIRNEKGEAVRLIGAMRDITKQKQEELEIKRSNERFELLGKAANDAIWEVNLERDELWANLTHQEMFGLTLEDPVPKIEEWIIRLHDDEKEKILHFLDKSTKAREKIWVIEYRFNSVNKGWIDIFARTYLEYNQDGKLIRMIGSMQDVTKRKQEEKRLRLLESVVVNTNDAILITEAEPFDEPGPKIIFVNEAFTKMTGYTPDEVIGKTPRILQGPKSDTKELKKVSDALKKWEPCEISTINYKKSGEEFWVNFSVMPIADDKGFYTHWIAIERDITVRKNEELQKLLLAEISLLFSEYSSLKETLEHVLDKICDFGDFTFTEAWIISTDNKKINLISKCANSDEISNFYDNDHYCKSHVSGEGLAGIVWKNEAITFWDDIQETQHKNGLRTAYGIPLLNNNRVVGVLNIGVTKENKSKILLQPLFENFGSYLGSEIKRKLLEQELNQIFSFAPDIISIAGYDGYFKKINPAACELLGYTEEELLAKPYSNFIYAEDQIRTTTAVTIDAVKNENFYIENRFVTKSGKIIWLAWTANASRSDELIFAVAKDITEKKELENLLNKANSLAKIGSWELDLIKRTLYWSDITKEIHDVDDNFQSDLDIGINYYKEGTNRDTIIKIVREALINGTSWDKELQIVTAKGNEKWVRNIGDTEFVNGKCVRIYGSFQDIDDRKKSELALNEAYEEKNIILESIGDAFLAVDKNWFVTYWNKEAERLLKIKKEDILGKDLNLTFSNSTSIEFHRNYVKAVEENTTVHFEEFSCRANKWFEVSAYPSSSGLSVYFKDVTERKQIQQQFESVISNMPGITYRCKMDENWTMLFISDGVMDVTGYQASDFMDNTRHFSSVIHPNDLHSTFEIEEALRKRELFDIEYRIHCKDGAMKWVQDKGRGVYDIENNLLYIDGIIMDITDRKNNENRLNELNKELKRRAKQLVMSNAELEQFAYVASHDLQEPLRMVTSFLTQLEKKYEPIIDEKGKQYIDFAVDGAKRMRMIILDLLEFSRVGRTESNIENIDINDLINEIKILFRKQIEDKNAVIKFENMPVILGHKTPLRQVFQNLISNALKYSKTEVPARIKIKAKEYKAYWQFSVSDNGIGFEKEYFERVFVIFQRLHNKEEYSGTGMGLAVAKKIIENQGGKIWVESIEGQGSTFYFTIYKAPLIL